MLLRFVLGPPSPPADLIVDCPAGAAWSDVLGELGDSGLAAQAHIGGVPLTPHALVGHPPLLHGAVIHFGPPPTEGRTSRFVLRAVSGIAAGAEFPIAAGRTVVGRGASADVVLNDPEVSRRHAEIVLNAGDGGLTVRDLGSANGTDVDHVPLGGTPRAIGDGTHIRIGRTALRFIDAQRAETAISVRSDGSGCLIVNVPPRLRSPRQAPEIAVPEYPPTRSTAAVSWVSIAVPMILAISLALAYGTRLLIVSLVAPLAGAGGMLIDHLRHVRRRRRDRADWEHRWAETVTAIGEAVAADLASRHRQAPDVGEILSMARRESPGLWQRRPGDADFGMVRIGTADLPSGVAVREADGRLRHPTVRCAPVTLSLTDHAIVGIAGPREQALGLARFLVMQLAVLHSPRHLGLRIHHREAPQESIARWSWMRWLPHGATGSPAVAMLDRSPLTDVPYVAAICLADSTGALPTECTAVMEFGSEDRVRLVTDATVTENVVPDLVGHAWTERCARALAPLRDAACLTASELPDLVWLADLLDLDPFDPAQVVEHWRRPDRRPHAVLGIGASGSYAIDLGHDGPHVLVAGMTGAGKSELLRTLVASLAISCRPDELAVVLIDYKGGAAFGECMRLPHTVGLVTDLDNELTGRALAGLNAELRRRERMFAHAAVSNLGEYEIRAKADGLPACARLVIVVDEFATLVDELPDFLTGLVSIARRGRSLGIHLVLATQRPAGVISGDIRANVALRIALRVADDTDSADVIGIPDATALPNPGRAIARSSDGEPVHFQSARVGSAVRRGRTRVRIVPADRWETPEPADAQSLGIDDLAAALRVAAARLEIPATPAPWAPPLPSHLPASGLPRIDGPCVGIGLVDIPDEQRHATLAIDLSAGDHWLVAGGPGSGKTVLARTAIAQLVRGFAVAQVHFYVIDDAGGLADLAGLPHCGAVVSSHESRRAARLFERLSQEVDRRRELRARQPWLLLVIDGWSGFAEAAETIDHGRPLQTLRRLLRDGPAAGVTVVLTGDRDILTARIGAHVAHRLVLRLPDPVDYAAAGLAPRSAPRDPPPGCGVLAPAGHAVQIAVVREDPTEWVADTARNAATASTTDDRPFSAGQLRPFRVERLPDRVTMDDVRSRLRHREWDGRWVPLGLGGDELQPVGIDLSGRVVLVAGPRRSGRTTALRTISSWCRLHRIPVVEVRPGMAAELGMAGDGAVYVVDDVEAVLGTSLDTALSAIAGAASHDGIVIAGRTETLARAYSGIAAHGRRNGSLLLLGPPSSAELELAGTRIGKDEHPVPGRAVLVIDGEPTEMQIAQPFAAG